MTLTDNALQGALPDTWGQASAFPKLAIMALSGNNLTGSFPAAWAANSSFPSMRGSGNGMCVALPRLCLFIRGYYPVAYSGHDTCMHLSRQHAV